MKVNVSKKLVGALAAATMMASTATHAADVTGTANAEVKTPISISAGAALNYGNIAVGASGGTAVLDTADSLSVTGDVSALSGVTPASGAFTVSGEGTSAYTITLPSTITLNSGANSMTVSSLGHSAGGSPALTAGSDTFKVGGTLTVGAAQATGAYSGSYTVTVNYQ